MSAERSLGVTLVKTMSGSESVDLTLSDLTTIGAIGIESEEIDVTTLDSTGGFKEFIMGSKDAGEVPIEGFTKSEANIDALYTLAGNQQIEEWTMTFVSGSKWVFDACVKAFKEAESTVDGVRGFTGSLRITGQPVYTKVTPSA